MTNPSETPAVRTAGEDSSAPGPLATNGRSSTTVGSPVEGASPIEGSSPAEGAAAPINLSAPGCFPYGEAEVAYLKSKDKVLAPIIDRIGHVDRAMDPGLFESVMRSIIGQQVSTAAQQTISRRLREGLGEVTPQTVAAAGVERLQSFGTTFRKAEYMHEFASKVANGDFDLDAVAAMPDAEAIAALASLRGIGTWTAEMILLFSLGRSDIFAFDDLAIQRGMRMVYHHRTITRALFEKYRRRFSPCCSVASLYFWEVSHGAVDGLVDHAPKKKTR